MFEIHKIITDVFDELNNRIAEGWQYLWSKKDPNLWSILETCLKRDSHSSLFIQVSTANMSFNPVVTALV